MTKQQRKRMSTAMRRSWKKRKNAARADVTAVPPTRELDDLEVNVSRALQLIQDGMRMCNEGWDLVNSIPKRVS